MRAFRQRTARRPEAERFTYVLIDCPPSLNLLTMNAMAAADSVLVPLQCEFFALEGLSQLLTTVDQVRTDAQSDADHPWHRAHHVRFAQQPAAQVVADVRGFMGDKVYDTVIPRNVRRLRGALVWQAGAALRSEMHRQPSLSQARVGSDPARAGLRARSRHPAEIESA